MVATPIPEVGGTLVKLKSLYSCYIVFQLQAFENTNSENAR